MRLHAWNPVLVLLAIIVPLGAAEGDRVPPDRVPADRVPPDRVEADRWFVGHLNGQPAVSLHEVTLRRADGSRQTQTDTALVIVRSLGEGDKQRLEVRDAQVFEEDAQGRVVSFRLDHEEGGARTSAVGRVEPGEGGAPGRVVASVHRLGRRSDLILPLTAGGEPVSDRRAFELLAARGLGEGESMAQSGLSLLQERVVLARTTSTFLGFNREGHRQFRQVTDVIPVPMDMTLSANGELQAMRLDLGIFALELTPSDGPVALLGADLPATGLLRAQGPAPAPGPRNRYRLPVAGAAADDEFQRADPADGAVLTVTAVAAPSMLEDAASWLAPEPHLELDDPALRRWVATCAVGLEGDAAALAEQLRLAVRGYLTRDLSVGDASALATFRSRKGDCTEHAALLCAALRIAGVPARIEIGAVWSADHGGWIGHAWNSAHIGERWVHLDSAFPGQPRSCYLKLADGSGQGATTGPAALAAALAALGGKPVETLAP